MHPIAASLQPSHLCRKEHQIRLETQSHALDLEIIPLAGGAGRRSQLGGNMYKKPVRGGHKARIEPEGITAETDVTLQSHEPSHLLASDSVDSTTSVQDVEEDVVLFRPRLYWG